MDGEVRTSALGPGEGPGGHGEASEERREEGGQDNQIALHVFPF